MEVNSLARVIYRIESSKLKDKIGSQTKIVIIDSKSGETFEKKPIFTMGKDLRYFRVMTTPQSVECRGPRYEIGGPSFDERLKLEILYRARCRSGDEFKLVSALGRYDRPDQALNNFFLQWIEEFASERQAAGEDLYQEFHRLHADLERFLEKKARREAGLSLRVRLDAHGERQLESVLVIKISEMDIYVRDSDLSLKLGLEAKFEIADKTQALRRRVETAELEEEIRDEVRRFLLEKSNLHEVSYELRTKVREHLSAHLDQAVAAPIGRRLSFIKLDGQAVPRLPKKALRVECSTLCDIRESNEKIHVDHVVQLRLEDLGKYQISDVDNLESWMREQLDNITRELLFEMTYRDLLRDFAPGETRGHERLKESVEMSARTVGYRIQQMTTIPDLKPIKWRDGIAIEFEETFVTRDPKVEVSMGIILSGKIIEPFDSRLERYLEPRAAARFESEVSEKVVKELRKHLHDMDPERVYMRFLRSEIPGEEPVKTTLEGTAIEIIEKQFVFEDAYAVIKPMETELTRRAEELMARSHQLTVAVHPLSGLGQREPVKLRLNYDIIGVDSEGWHTFQTKNLCRPIGEAEIRTVLKEDIEATLSTVPSEVLQFVDRQSQMTILEILRKSAVRTVINTFGLVISLVNLYREQTLAENAETRKTEWSIEEQMELAKKTGEMTRESQVKALGHRIDQNQELLKGTKEELQELLSRKNELIKQGVDELNEDEYNRVEEQIDKITAEINANPIYEEKDHLAHMRGKTSVRLSLEEYEQRRLSPKDQKKIIEETSR